MNHRFFVSFCFGQSVSAKSIFSLASVKMRFGVFLCVVFPPHCGNSIIFKAGGEAKQPGPVSHTAKKKKKKHTLEKKIKVLPLRHTMRDDDDDDDDHADDVNLHFKLTACAITQSC